MSNTYPDLNLTNFPNSIDGKYTMKDASNTNITKIKRYEAYVAEGNIEAANQYLANNKDLIPVLFNADKWNRHEHMILALENFFNDEVYDYIINVVKLRGMYDSSTIYSKFNVVGYTSGGATQYYMAAKRVPSGISPVSADASSYWIELTLRGEQGNPGIGTSYAGLYDSTTTYSENECVTHDNGLWYSLVNNNLNHTPSLDDGTHWEKMFEISATASTVKFSDNTTVQAWRNTVDSTLTSDHTDIVNLKRNNITVYISNTGSNDNDGLSADAPLLNLSGLSNLYKNTKQLIIKFLNGTYTDHIIFNAYQYVTITSNSGNASDVIFTGGIEVNNSSAIVKDVTFNGATYDGSALVIRRSNITVQDCAFIGASDKACLKCITSQANVQDCSFSTGLYAIRGENAAYIGVQGCTGSNITTSYCAVSGSTINYSSDNNITATTTTYYGAGAGVMLSNSVLPLVNGGTGASTILEAKANLAMGYARLFNGSAHNGEEVNYFTDDSASLYNVFSITLQTVENGTSVLCYLMGYKDGKSISFSGYSKGYLISGYIGLRSDRSFFQFSAYKKSNLNVDIASSFTVTTINGIV